MPLTCLITGASRGIGAELVKELAARGERVIACVRDPSKARPPAGVQAVELDVADEKSIIGLGKRVGDTPIDVLINNAGVWSDQKSVSSLTLGEMTRVFTTNTFGPMLVTRALLDHVKRGRRKLIVSMSSEMGSIAGNVGGSSYAYRGSKAALNQMNRSLAIELRPDGVACVVMHPGWVRTDMGGRNAPLSVGESAAAMIATIDRLALADSGRFVGRDGADIPW